MLNPELDDFISSELNSLSEGLARTPPALPQHLYLPTDAGSLDRLVRDGVMRAWHSRLSAHAGATQYGVTLVEAWIARQCAAEAPGSAREFYAALVRLLDPRGSHFDFFLAPLFEATGATLPVGPVPVYETRLLCARLACSGGAAASLPGNARMSLRQAIYDEAEQQQSITTICKRHADYFGSACQRFGPRNQDDVLLRCIDSARRALGEVTVCLRDPALGWQGEWIAIALGNQLRTPDSVRFDIVDGLFAAYVDLDICAQAAPTRRLAIDQVVVLAQGLHPALHEMLEARLRAPDALRPVVRCRIVGQPPEAGEAKVAGERVSRATGYVEGRVNADQ